ncbi:MAG TPA: ATPase, T2SS/T4P/T4SS family [Blastocatellia bacterium]|nr:ATPase, T2SS/T4P/T4SS family [Blastocatellia bacterium]
MFFIVDDEIPLRFTGSGVALGLTPDGDFALNPERPVCEVSRNALKEWMVAPTGEGSVSINHSELTRAHKLLPSDLIGIGSHRIEVRYQDHDRIIARAIQERQFKLEADLHHTVMDLVGHSAAGLSPQEYRSRIESAIDKALAETAIEPEIEEYLAIQALRELLLDTIHGYERRPDGHPSRKDQPDLGRLIEGLKQIVRVNPNETAVQKAERVDLLLPWALRRRKVKVDPSQRRALALGLIREQLLDLVFGLGPLRDLMVAGDVNDILVLPSGKIYIERGGRIQDSGRRMASPVISNEICQRIVGGVGRRLDQSSPMVDARMPDGSRLNAVISPVSINGPALTIRRFPSKRLTIDDLIEKGALTRPIADFLRACVIARKNIVVSGGTGSGKTTLLNILASSIPAGERVVTVEDTAELQLPHEHVVTMQSRPPNLEGKGAIPIRELVRNTLRMRPDRIVVGECRGGETLDMLQAMNTGHDGSLTTIHANEPPEAMLRLEVMALEAEGIDLPSRAIREIIASAVDVVVQVARLAGGARRLTSISEVVGFDGTDGAIIVEEIFKLPPDAGKRHPAGGALAFTGYVPGFIDELLQVNGLTVESIF